MFSESSTGHRAVPKLLCCQSKHRELSENNLQKLFHNLTPQNVQNHDPSTTPHSPHIPCLFSGNDGALNEYKPDDHGEAQQSLYDEE